MATPKAERFPILNPIRFIKANDTLAAGINNWPTDRGWFHEHRRTWQYGNTYQQKYQYTDAIDIYFDTLATDALLHVYDDQGDEVASVMIFSGSVAVPGNTVNVGGVDYPFNSFYVSFN